MSKAKEIDALASTDGSHIRLKITDSDGRDQTLVFATTDTARIIEFMLLAAQHASKNDPAPPDDLPYPDRAGFGASCPWHVTVIGEDLKICPTLVMDYGRVSIGFVVDRDMLTPILDKVRSDFPVRRIEHSEPITIYDENADIERVVELTFKIELDIMAMRAAATPGNRLTFSDGAINFSVKPIKN